MSKLHLCIATAGKSIYVQHVTAWAWLNVPRFSGGDKFISGLSWRQVAGSIPTLSSSRVTGSYNAFVSPPPGRAALIPSPLFIELISRASLRVWGMTTWFIFLPVHPVISCVYGFVLWRLLVVAKIQIPGVLPMFCSLMFTHHKEFLPRCRWFLHPSREFSHRKINEPTRFRQMLYCLLKSCPFLWSWLYHTTPQFPLNVEG